MEDEKIFNVSIIDNDVKINNIVIDTKVFDDEIVSYRVMDRESEVDNLIQWISECKNSDKFAMKTDLGELMVWNDTLILSSVNTNDYVSESSDIEAFNEIIIEILNAHKKLHPDANIGTTYRVHFEKTLGIDVEVVAFSEEEATEIARNSKLDKTKIDNPNNHYKIDNYSGFEYCYTDLVE